MGDQGEIIHLRGREQELAELVAAFRSAQEGRMTLVLVSGDAGVGKTRLASELALLARSEQTMVLSGRAIDIADAPPFWPMISAIRNAVRSASPGPAVELLARWLADVTPTAPAEDRPVRPPVQLLELLHEVIVDLAALRPVVLIIEDLQWADRSTRDLLNYLVANLSAEPVLIIGTYRTDTPERNPGLTATLGELRRHRKVSSVRLEPLSRAALADLVADWAPDRPGLEPLVWQRSGGNAFIAEETVRSVLGGDALGLPTTLRDLVLSRIALLSPAAQQVVRAVAVSAGPLPHPLLVDVLQLPAPVLLEALREAVGLGIAAVQEDDDGYRLRHGLMTEVVLADLLPGERIDLHRRYASALSQGGEPETASLMTRLAHHWYEAGDAERALVATLSAARASERIRAYAEAYRHWLRAAELSARTHGSVEVRRADCLDRAAQAADLAGDHEQALRLLDQLHTDLGAPGGLVSALLTARKGASLAAAGRGREAGGAYRGAAALLPSTGSESERARVLSGYSAVLLQAGDFAGARTVAGEALELARASRSRTTEAKVLAVLGFSLAYLEDTSAGDDCLTEALAVAERTGEPEAIGEAFLRRAELLAGPLNQLVDGVAYARQGAQRMQHLGLARTAGVALLTHAANGLFRQGHWDDAQRAVGEAWALAPTGAGALEVRLARGRLDLARGRLDAAADDLEAVELLASSTVGPRYQVPLLILRAGLQMWRGDPVVALEYVEEGFTVAEAGADDLWSLAPLVWHGTRAWAEMTRLGLAQPSAGQVRRLHDRCEELGRRCADAVPAVAAVVEAFTTMCAAETSRAQDRADPEAWQRATQMWERHEQPYPAAYARLRHAEALLTSRARSAPAAQLLRQAERVARGLGARPLLSEIVDLATRARVPLDDQPRAQSPAPSASAGPLDALTARELEVLGELAEGRTNREIAHRLFISEKTVGVHVSRIFTKIGVHSRMQASAILQRSRRGEPAPRRV
jgi:DNA-binding CsgD family transcriptional regulator/tetratricopeptide (TPR) repeat protein